MGSFLENEFLSIFYMILAKLLLLIFIILELG